MRVASNFGNLLSELKSDRLVDCLGIGRGRILKIKVVSDVTSERDAKARVLDAAEWLRFRGLRL